jgi:hypothetical protein
MVSVAVSVFLSLVIVLGHAQVAPLLEVKAIVVDETGAVIPGCEIVFKSDSETIAAHTSTDGSLTLKLPSGKYAVTVTRAGFVKSKTFQIVTPMQDALRVVLKVDQTSSEGPLVDAVPTATSDLPSIITSGPSRVPSVPPVTRKSRSWHCLYLWRCSTSSFS